MKRFAGSGLKVGVVFLLTVIISGCVSQEKYDQLKFAQRNSESERERLAAELAGARTTINSLNGEISRLKDILTVRENSIQVLQQQLAGAQGHLGKMTEIYEELASRQIPMGTVLATPLPPALDTALKHFAQKHSGMVEYDSARGILKFTSDVLFDLGSAKVKDNVVAALQEFARILDMPEAGEFDAVIVGHTDNVPIGRPETRAQHPTNWHLSVHRSISVMNVLSGAGVGSDRMGVMGYGEYRPIFDNTSAENRAKNRRVEIYIVPKQAIGDRNIRAASESAPQPTVTRALIEK